MLSAKSVLKKFTVTFNPDNDKASTAVTVEWGKTVTEPEVPIAESDGLKFDGWYSGETKYVFTDPVKDNLTLTAKWIEKNKVSVTVKYGNGTDDRREEYNEGAKYSLPDSPVWEGHTFLGWLVGDSTEAENPKTEITLTSSIVITAKWEIIKVKVTFDTAGGSAISDMTLNWGDTLSDISTTREGYEFDGWKKGTETFDISTPVKEDTLLTAVWKIKAFTVTFVDGSKKLGEKTVDWNTAVSAIDTPQKTGYTFSRWLNGSTEYDFESRVTENITLTADWTIKTYEIKFVTGVETAVPSQSVEYGKNATEPTQSLSKTGYHLAGWCNGGVKYDFNSAVEGNLTLTAKWEKNRYKVVYKLESSDLTYFDTAEVEYEGTVNAPEKTPGKEGHTFSRWLKNGEEYNFNTPVTENTILVAEWSVNKVTVTFKNGDEVSATREIDWGTSVDWPEAPTSESKVFAYWTEDGSSRYDFSTEVKEDIVLEAYFIGTDEIIVSFVNYDKVTGNTDTYSTEVHKKTDTLTLPTYTSTGRSFDGWECPDDTTRLGGAEYSLSGITDTSITFTAKWTVTGITVHFNPMNDEEGTIVVIESGSTVTPPSDPERYNSEFIGWQRNGYSGLYDFSSPICPPYDDGNDVYFYAEYTPDEYYVTFNPDNGEKSWVVPTDWGNPNLADSLGTDPKKDGYAFAGWYIDELTEFDFKTPIKQDYSLTAHWVKEGEKVAGHYVVTFNYNDPSMENDTFTVPAGTHTHTLEYKTDVSGNNHPEGKTFVKWVKEDGSDLEVGGIDITSDMTLTAVWETQQVTVSFESNCETDVPSQTFDWGGTATDPGVMEREGAEFLGWYYYTLDGERKKYDFSTPVTASLSLSALWNPDYFIVTFNPNNGESEWKRELHSYGDPIETPVDPVYSGKTFAG